jgi:hypothetical protein
MWKAAIGAIALCTAGLAWAEPAICKAEPKEEQLALAYGFEVAGKGRLYFHSAPNDLCITKKVFVIPGDRLDAISVFGKHAEWVYVNYEPKEADMVSGWVKAERLMFTGASGVNMTEEKHKYFTKAAAAAKAGKMGVP